MASEIIWVCEMLIGFSGSSLKDSEKEECFYVLNDKGPINFSQEKSYLVQVYIQNIIN